jgi:pyruvate formate lyase activating enzyme
MRDNLGLGAERGIVSDIQRFSVRDGAGIRTMVYLKGCTMRCRWCHNPEGVRHYPEVFHYWPRCTNCGKCDEICPAGAMKLIENVEWGGEERDASSSLSQLQKRELELAGIKVSHVIKKRTSRKIRIEKDKCIGCFRCVEVCPEEAFVVVGRFMTVDEVLEEVLSDKVFYDTSGGGMTLSGGDPTAQPHFALALLKGAKERGLHTALDTNGNLEWGFMEKLLEYTDLVLYDIKAMDSNIHESLTGVSNDLILENAQKIAEKKNLEMRVRFPVIPGVNDGKENIEKTARFVKSLKVGWVDILPYHAFAGQKYRLFSLDFPFPVGEEYPEEKLESIKDIFEAMGLQYTIGG